MKLYYTFAELWEEKYSHYPECIKQLAQDVWEAAVEGFAVETYDHAVILADAIKRKMNTEDDVTD